MLHGVQLRPARFFKVFRGCGGYSDRRQPGQSASVSQPAATELDLTELDLTEKKLPGGGKPLLFKKPTVNGVVSPFPVAAKRTASFSHRVGEKLG
jgi:hypothetical protein